ncbi:MAG TPA: phytanoyl-CoA dioxygenase family protein, partial [Jatrophihabitantaceae bacterium]|nr:phytanoyl-CoA dioxygenase family protein [Jatrophihabitantaceae bacterium]
MTEEAGQRTRALPSALTSNGVEIPFDEQYFTPMRDSSPDDPEAARRAFADEGYVLLRSVLDRDAVLELRADYFRRFDPSLLAPGSTPKDGVFSGTVPDLPEYGTQGHPAYDFVRSAEFDTFTQDRRLHSIAELLLDGSAELLPRRIVRHFHSGARRASRAHIDYDYMDHGTDQVVTAWIPLGDCPVESGGLVYLERSHHIARAHLDGLRTHTDRPTDHRPISNDLALTARELGG